MLFEIINWNVSHRTNHSLKQIMLLEENILLATIFINYLPKFVGHSIKAADLYKCSKNFWAVWVYLQPLQDALPSFWEFHMVKMPSEHFCVMVEQRLEMRTLASPFCDQMPWGISDKEKQYTHSGTLGYMQKCRQIPDWRGIQHWIALPSNCTHPNLFSRSTTTMQLQG